MPKFEKILLASIACASIEEAVGPIQNFLDIKDGGIASVCLDDCVEKWPNMTLSDRHQRLAAYIHSELLWMTPH